jgi:uncharacterized Zn finger protein (UPF0148 family)
MFCPKCNAPVIVEDPEAPPPGKYPANAAGPLAARQVPGAATAVRQANGNPMTPAASASYPQSSSSTSVDPAVSDDRPPPRSRGKTATDIVSQKLGEKLLQGWRMDKDACGTCGIPLMTPKDSSVQVCIMCQDVTPFNTHAAHMAATRYPSKSTTAAVSTFTPVVSTREASITHSTPVVMKRTPENAQSSSDEAASRMGVKLVSGWRMNAQSCSVCNVPLMSAKGESNQLCVMCERWFDAGGQPLTTSSKGVVASVAPATTVQQVSISKDRLTPAASNDYELDDLAAWRAKMHGSRSNLGASSEWSAALDDVVKGVRADEHAGPGSRTLPHGGSSKSATIPASLPYVPAPVLTIAEPSNADIEKLARALDKAATHEALERDSQLLCAAKVLAKAETECTPLQQSTRPANCAHAVQSLMDVLQQQNTKIMQLGMRTSSEPAFLTAFLEAAVTIPTLVEAIKALQSL